MMTIEDRGDERRIVTPALTLAFRWTGDRWAHRLSSGPDAPPLIESFESDLGDDPQRVISPTYQDLHIQEAGNEVQAMLVGQSGPHHFSVVFRVVENPPEPVRERVTTTQIVVDLADRCRMPVEVLGCTYVMHASMSSLLEGDPESASWLIDTGQGGLGVTLSVCGPDSTPSRLGVIDAGPQSFHIQVISQPNAAQSTHRLAFVWSASRATGAANAVSGCQE